MDRRGNFALMSQRELQRDCSARTQRDCRSITEGLQRNSRGIAEHECRGIAEGLQRVCSGIQRDCRGIQTDCREIADGLQSKTPVGNMKTKAGLSGKNPTRVLRRSPVRRAPLTS